MSLIRPLIAVAAAASLTACATASKVGDVVNPFNESDKNTVSKTVPEEGRVSILSFEQKLEADSGLSGRVPEIPAAAPMAEWPSPGGAVDNAPGNIAIDAPLTVAWKRSAGAGSKDRARISAPPVAALGHVFLMDADQVVHARSAEGGDTWRAAMRPEKSKDSAALGGGVAFGDGRLYAVSGYGVAAAFDPQSGKELWRHTFDSPFSSAPVAANGRVYAITNDSELFAMDGATGETLWSHQAIAEPARILSAPSAAVVGDTVVAPFASGEVVALLAANGRRLWVDALSRSGRLTSLSAINDVAGRPVVKDGTVYAASHSGILAAIDQRTGQRLWARAFASTQTPLVAGEAIFAVTVDGELAALERKSGKVFWVSQLRRYKDTKEEKGLISWSGPILAGSRLVLASSNGDVALVSPDNGKVEQTLNVNAPVFIPPIAANGTIYLLTDKGELVALK